MDNKEIVLIPSATIVPKELQSLGKLPAVIYPINKKIVFDYLYKYYRKYQINVLIYEKEDMVRRRLGNYTDKNVNLYKIPELSDLGHTIYYGLENIEGAVIINFGDTIVEDNKLDFVTDAVVYEEDYVSEEWTYFDEKDGVITKIYDKVKRFETSKKEKLFVGVFKFSDAKLLKKCLEEEFEKVFEEESSFYRALVRYSRIKPLRTIKTDTWFDIGHVDRYYNTKLEVSAREFNHITIDKNRGILRKTSDDKEKFIGEIKWYLKLPSNIEYCRPRIFSYSTEYDNPYVEMEYYAYHTVHELFLHGDLEYHQWVDMFSKIRFIINDFGKYRVKKDDFSTDLEEMYLNKTIKRLEMLEKDEFFFSFVNNKIIINGRTFLSLSDIKEKIKSVVPKLLYEVNSFTIIHGDLCFANMMVDKNISFVKVIDPRGKFGEFDIYGDQRYELAKILHSVDGKYDYIIKDLFELSFDMDKVSIDYEILERKRNYDIFTIFKNVFEEELRNSLKQIELIEALLFLSMIPLHGESRAHQLVMLATGIEIFTRVENIEIEKRD